MRDAKENLLKEKSYAFALRIISLYKHLTAESKEYVLSKQVLRSGTSVGANITEATALSPKWISYISFRSHLKKRTN